MSPLIIIVPAAVIVAALALFIIIKICYKVAAPSQAGIISGFGIKGASGSNDGADALKVVTGGGKLVIPGLQRWELLSLAQHKAELRVEGVDSQKIQTGTHGVVLFKINDDPVSITNAARRYLEGGQSLDSNVKDIFEGHLRAIIGGMTIEKLIEDRAELARKVREACDEEMQNMGLRIDSFQIREILDPSGYIVALGAPQTAEVKMQARIAEANRNRQAEQAEQEAAALQAQARRDSEVTQAALQAEVDQARAKSDQAGPLAEAEARKAVVEQETEVARLRAAQTEQELQSTVVKQAQAQAEKVRIDAQGARDARVAAAEGQASELEKLGAARASATTATGSAEAEVIRQKGFAEAEALHKRAEALSKNQEAVIGQTIAENMESIVRASADVFKGVDNMTVLNGAQGISEILNQVIGQAGSSLGLAKQIMAQTKEMTSVNLLGGSEGHHDVPSAKDSSSEEVLLEAR